MTETFDEVAEKAGFTPSAPRITPALVEAMIAEESYFVLPGSTVTICALGLYNGFRVMGESACASPENFNEEVGRYYAKRNAVQKIWPFAGFWLCQKLWQDKGLYDVVTVDFWIGDLPGPKDPLFTDESANPAVPVIDAVRDSHLEAPAGFGTVAFTRRQALEAVSIKAQIAATAEALAEAGVLTEAERDKLVANSPCEAELGGKTQS